MQTRFTLETYPKFSPKREPFSMLILYGLGKNKAGRCRNLYRVKAAWANITQRGPSAGESGVLLHDCLAHVHRSQRDSEVKLEPKCIGSECIIVVHLNSLIKNPLVI